MIERVRLQVQASKMRFLQKIIGVTLLTRYTSRKIRKSLEPLLLQIQRSQRRWFGHVSRMHQKKLFFFLAKALLAKLYLPKQMGKQTVGQSRTIVDESILH